MIEIESFEQAVEYLNRFGVEFQQDYDYGKQGTDERHSFDVKVLSSLLLPFSPEEWCSLCMSEGDNYIGGCCGTTSAAQDIVEYAFRFGGGWIDGRELLKLGDLMDSHDESDETVYGFTSNPKDIPDASVWATLGPWSKLALIWHISKDYLIREVPLAAGEHVSELEAAIGTLRGGLTYLDYERLFNKHSNSQDDAARILELAKILPALQVVYNQIETLYTGPFEGFALVDKSVGPDAVAKNGAGLCLYATQEEVEAILKIWRKQEVQYEERAERVKPIDERIGIRRVRITMEKGLEFLE